MSTSRRALLLPGRAYPTTMPLLFFTGLALAEHGWTACPVRWTLPPDVPDSNRWVADRAAAAVAAEPPTDRWLYAAKSLGTRIVHAATDGLRADAYVLLTPLLVEPEAVDAVGALVSDGVPVLIVGGTADQLWSAEGARETGATMLEVPDADHAMTVPGDAVRTAQVHLEVTRAVDAFLGSLTS
jgi:pimeloyl-ACP methyl ester carboxylesterase